MRKAKECLEKIDHTICLAFNENNNAIFGKDKYEGIDCKDIYEFGECYEVLEETLCQADKDRLLLNLLKKKRVDICTFMCILHAHGSKRDDVQFVLYNSCCSPEYKLTKREFTLIKRWLTK